MITVPSNEVQTELNTPSQPSRHHGVLVVAADEGMRDMLNVWLRHKGYGVWIAATGLEGVDLYEHYRDAISVVLLDVSMPVMDGPQTLIALRQLNPRICCCFMSDKLDGYTGKSLLDMGAEEVLRKPFRLVDLEAHLWKLVEPLQRQSTMADDLWRDDGGQG